MQLQVSVLLFGRTALLSTFTIATLLLLTACGGGGSDGGGSGGGANVGVVGTSKNNSTRSHNAGVACSDCHKAGGTGQGIFTVSGTVYTNGAGSTVAPNGTVKIYSDMNRLNLVTTLEVDAKGNFYTVDPVDGLTDIGGGIAGVYVTVGSRNMPGSVSSNACNSCHGPATTTSPGGVNRIY
jgi:hypothetical protein